MASGDERMPMTPSTEPRPGDVEDPPLLTVRTMLVVLAVGLASALGLSGLGRLATDSLAILALLFELGLLAGLTATLATRRLKIAGALRLAGVPASVYWPALQLGIALVIANMAAAVFIGPLPEQVELVTEAEGTLEWAALIALVVIAAPLIEEVLFRGLIQGALEARLGHWAAIVLAGGAFAAVHGPQAAPFFLFWSLPVGWITWRSGSIRPAIVVHAVNNLTGVALFLLVAEPSGSPERLDPTSGTLVVILTVLVLMGAWAVSACRQADERLS